MTVKEVLQEACGNNRNMTTFAEEISQDISVSASTLYRLSAGEYRRAISTDFLQAIIKHADPSFTLTLDELEEIFKTQCVTVSQSRRMRKALLMENLAKRAILEAAIESGADVSQSSPIITDQHYGMRRVYDSSLLLKRDGITQTAYFEIKAYQTKVKASLIDMAVGQMLREDPAPNKYYYLVLVSEERPNPDIIELLERLSGTKMSLNLSIVSMVMDREGNYSSEQINLGADDGIVSFKN